MCPPHIAPPCKFFARCIVPPPRIVPPSRFFEYCILTGKAMKLILYDFSSNFILNMWPGLFVGGRQRLLFIMELSIHCYTALILDIGCKFGYLSAT